MEFDQDLAGLSELHKTLADASEQLAAFISCGKSEEVAIDSLVKAADQTLADLTKWRGGLQSALLGASKPH